MMPLGFQLDVLIVVTELGNMSLGAGAMLIPLAMACAKTTPMALTAEGARVRITGGDRVTGCEYVGDFVGGFVPVSRPLGVPGAWASNQARNLAAEHGATDVVLAYQPDGNVVGKGYKCP
jgi:hypothetical protein